MKSLRPFNYSYFTAQTVDAVLIPSASLIPLICTSQYVAPFANSAALPQEDILDLFTHASSYAAGRRVVVHQPGGEGVAVIRGVTAGLDPSGFLKVRQDDGTYTLILAGGVRAAGS